MLVRSLGFLTDLAVLRAGGSSVTEAGDHAVVRTMDNPSFWWGNFVLVSGPDQVGRGVDIFRREFPEARHLAIGVDGADGAVPASAAAVGLESDTSVVLTTRTLAPASPVDAEVRLLATDQDFEDLVLLRRSDDHPASDLAFARARVAEARRITETDKGFFLGAFKHGTLVASLGIVSVGSRTARYQNVQTHPGHRRQGLAANLTAFAGELARERWSLDRLVIVADPHGPAIALYRRLGFQDTELQLQLMKPVTAGAQASPSDDRTADPSAQAR